MCAQLTDKPTQRVFTLFNHQSKHCKQLYKEHGTWRGGLHCAINRLWVMLDKIFKLSQPQVPWDHDALQGTVRVTYNTDKCLAQCLACNGHLLNGYFCYHNSRKAWPSIVLGEPRRRHVLWVDCFCWTEAMSKAFSLLTWSGVQWKVYVCETEKEGGERRSEEGGEGEGGERGRDGKGGKEWEYVLGEWRYQKKGERGKKQLSEEARCSCH